MPGDALDDVGVRYSPALEGEPVVFEYTVHPEQRQIRIPVLVWFHSLSFFHPALKGEMGWSAAW
ncbi:hypothetical protein [Streptomyces wuyuanensis]|uniref:hypothetical protein n=1 Tax=Streptomyces wuyuanensis TaxID=1196353 RepID=UPI00341CA693